MPYLHCTSHRDQLKNMYCKSIVIHFCFWGSLVWGARVVALIQKTDASNYGKSDQPFLDKH